MKYHITKFLRRMRDISQMIRVIFTEDSFIISYKSKFQLHPVKTDTVLIIDTIVEPLSHLDLSKTTKKPDILIHPYRYPEETDKEYFARIRAGMIR